MRQQNSSPSDTKIIEQDGKKYIATQLAKGKQNGVDNSCVNADLKKVTVNVFFDGTLNNIYNANPNASGAKESSYENDYSNIGRMFKSVEKEPNNIYIEGAGTARGKTDDQNGFALGTGETGIKKHTQQAIDAVKNYLNNKQTEGTRVVINVFGFSRGAATARHFVGTVHNSPFIFQGSSGQYPFSIGFVGLFDTVSSFANNKTEVIQQTVNRTGLDKEAPFADDSAYGQLLLKFDYQSAARVFHLVAGDEFRINFSLTNIQSAIDNGVGYEVQIPGAHSDIGGGYLSKVKEYRDIYTTNMQFDLANHLTWWGWYKSKKFNDDADETWFRQETSERSKQVMHCHMWRGDLRYHYYRVALRVMLEMVKRYTSIKFPNSDLLNTNIPNNTDPWNSLRQLSNDISKHVLQHAPQLCDKVGKRAPNFVMPYNTPSDTAYSRRIYRNFIHFSSNDAIAEGFTAEFMDIRPRQIRIGSDGRPYRRKFEG